MNSDESLNEQVRRFREWAKGDLPDERSGEWECDYPHWAQFYEAVQKLIADKQPAEWTMEQLDGVLYAVARDNECGILADTIRKYPDLLLFLAAASLERGEGDAKWQIADQLGRLALPPAHTESLLLRMAADEEEYVRRRALQSLARLYSPQTEIIALAVWNKPDKNQQWARMAALWSLQRVRSPLLGQMLIQAETDSLPYLSEYARRMRRGEVED